MPKKIEGNESSLEFKVKFPNGTKDNFRLAAGSGPVSDSKDQAMARLGEPFAGDFNACTSTVEMRAVIEKYSDQMTDDELKSLVEFVNLMSFLIDY